MAAHVGEGAAIILYENDAEELEAVSCCEMERVRHRRRKGSRQQRGMGGSGLWLVPKREDES